VHSVVASRQRPSPRGGVSRQVTTSIRRFPGAPWRTTAHRPREGRWHYAWHYEAWRTKLVDGAARGVRQALGAGQGEAPFLIMPGSRVRVPPLLSFEASRSHGDAGLSSSSISGAALAMWSATSPAHFASSRAAARALRGRRALLRERGAGGNPAGGGGAGEHGAPERCVPVGISVRT
jgi:hypothetical protein